MKSGRLVVWWPGAFSGGYSHKKKSAKNLVFFAVFEKKQKNTIAIPADCRYTQNTASKSAAEKTVSGEKQVNRKQRTENEKAYNTPERGRGKSCWVFHPASKTLPEIREIVFHYLSPSGEVSAVSFPKTGKGSVVVPVRVNFFDVMEISAGYDVAPGFPDVVVNFHFSYGRKEYSRQSKKTVPCLRLSYKLQGWRIRQTVDSVPRTEWTAKPVDGVQSSIGSPGYNGSKGWLNSSGFWLENIH